ncbi:hypothetical protein Cme02nite_07140 [Catellatospora methionotrophica]|uniref:Uncharacterized protein n=1 Tax=Catellatospora methionotrophica TaxID=121620 RepID=A0A8J3L5A4_9ACTN|nr:hypothetical protein Cme02nite_07140 [Catellatospora methionotrophica]
MLEDGRGGLVRGRGGVGAPLLGLRATGPGGEGEGEMVARGDLAPPRCQVVRVPSVDRRVALQPAREDPWMSMGHATNGRTAVQTCRCNFCAAQPPAARPGAYSYGDRFLFQILFHLCGILFQQSIDTGTRQVLAD